MDAERGRRLAEISATKLVLRSYSHSQLRMWSVEALIIRDPNHHSKDSQGMSSFER